MSKQHLVAVIGAGPAGIYGTRKLVEAGHRVLLINRDIKPGGLAEYGIFFDKQKMKEGLRKQFKRILADPRVFYLGHVTVGEDQALTLQDLRDTGFSAIVVAAGAQGTKKLGLPGEDLAGVYHAKDVVYHYNKLPPFSQRRYELGSRVAIIGMGNVMVDVANWLLNYQRVAEVTVVARRGPKEKAYDDSEFEVIEKYLDNADLRGEIERIRPDLEKVGQNVDEIIRAFVKDSTPPPGQKLRFRYLCSPVRVLPTPEGRVAGLEVEHNILAVENGRTVAKGTGRCSRLDLDSVIYAIGDQVDASLGLPFARGAFITSPAQSSSDPNAAPYQPYDPQTKQVLEGIFVIGWSRNASVGLVGVAKQDAERGMKVVNQYLAGKEGYPPELVEQKIEAVLDKLEENKVPFVTKEDIEILEAAERAEARKRNTWEYKFATDEEMLAIISAPKAVAN
ncbi:MAG TPA: FAD-dependent oxidoreductase [candidate division Zixibacteria bacterium]|nr:FAD-dependent oxidoreductase [candidate division Zixibacteria bacterium]